MQYQEKKGKNPEEQDPVPVSDTNYIAGFYKWFGLGLSVGNPFYHRDYDTYGKTSIIDLRVNAFSRKFAAELFLQNYKGFYIQNVQAAGDIIYKIPGMNIFSVGAGAYWIYNSRRFSIRAAFVQNERQRKSAGSTQRNSSTTASSPRKK